ncbi:MAG: hypothetical protein K2J68_01005, partial [Treponemataceae bacterium]|nr:hypothetical protein [Treponemataceae bacterium]
MLNGAFCEAKKSKAAKNAPILLDWQGRDAGIEIPNWLKFVAENDKQKIVKEFGLEDYMVWIFDVRGDNLEFLESWTDKVELQSNVAQSISMEVGRATQAALHAEENMSDAKISKAIEDVATVLSSVRVKGLERFASCWIKTGIGKQGAKNNRDVSYVYYAVWGVPKNSYKKQLDAAMKNLPESTAQDSLLMNVIDASIEKAILDDADASLEGTTYNDVK